MRVTSRYGRSCRGILLLACLLGLTAAASAALPYVHNFDCKNCHIPSLSVTQLGGGNVCLSCHDRTLSRLLNDGSTGVTTSAFSDLDASNAFNTNPVARPDMGQTSHNWGAPDVQPRAGATAPDRTLFPQFYSRFGSSLGRVTCSRCHNPHADRSNPLLLALGPCSTEQMCLACHSAWNLGSGHTNVTHPVGIDYAAAAAAAPGKYATPPAEDDCNLNTAAPSNLFGGKVQCGSCHQVHFADSDSSTPDLPANYGNLTMHGGDGKLLRGNGATRTDTSALCRNCHTYQAHGGSGEAVGCLRCHGGHANDPLTPPNYFMLRKQVTTATFGTVPGLDYSAAAVLDPAQKYTFWNDRVDGTATGYCERCHGDARTIGSGAGQYHVASAVCTDCHSHANATFGHGDGSAGGDCIACHGHDAGFEYAPGKLSQGKGSARSHSTHTEHDADDLRGPNIACSACHDTSNYPSFKAGTDLNGDGRYNLAETNVCDPCHSRGGALDGVEDLTVGAKNNWKIGVYSGDSLAVGKEWWCAGCHDAGSSVINGRQAPDVTRDNTASGYYLSGHGAMGIECGECHGLTMSHNFDGIKTYKAVANNYQIGYRLKDVSGTSYGARPMNIPNPNDFGIGCNYSPADSNLCFKCHQEDQLLNDTRADGVFECNTNPYRSATAITTGFRNMLAAGANGGAGDWPANIHWDHLADINIIFSNNFWDSDRDGTTDSRPNCVTCHNPHGAALADGNPTIRMTQQNLQIEWGNDPTYGDYGAIGPGANQNAICSIVCHSNGVRYYRPSPAPVLLSVQVADINSTDPAPAEAGFTNNRSIRVTFTVSGATATEMRLAEDANFTLNATGWLPFAASTDYTLSTRDGSKTIYARLRSGADLSAVLSTTIILDTVPPTMTAAALSSPNGGESWIQEAGYAITWSGIADDNLKTKPIDLAYSTDSGATFPYPVANGEDNDGTFTWTVPVVESTTVRLRATATDRAGNQNTDTSNGNFTIAAVTPVLSGITVSDSDSADPAPAEAGFTNNRTVTVSLSASKNPTLMKISENPAFTAVPWIPFAATSSFTLSSGEGSKTLYCKVNNGAGESEVRSASILFDQTAPALPNLTTPGGGEFWTRNTDWTIVWNVASIADPAPGMLKASPITLTYSTDNGNSYPDTIAGAIANSGSHLWRTPVPVSYAAKVRLTVTDKAGNRSADETGTFNVSPPAGYIVTNTGDAGGGSLRQALTDLVAAGGNETVWFNIPNADAGFVNGVAVISVTSAALPVLSQPGIIIDGRSQTALRGNTNPNGPEVRLMGTYSWYGLDVTAADVAVRGLQLTKWWAGFRTNAARTVLTDSHLGFSSDTTGFDGVNQRNYGHVKISSGASNTRIGDPGQGNYLSCSWIDIPLADSGGSGTVIDSNVFGILPNGAACSNSGTSGIISLEFNPATVRSNVLCGGGTGIYLYSGNHVIQGNTFGVWYDGAAWRDCGDQNEAIRLQSGGYNLFGGPNVATDDAHLNDSNVIDPGGYGILFINGGSDRIFGNFIGTNPERDETFPGLYGIYVGNQSSLRIGGGDAGESGNVIANMTNYGVYLSHASAKYNRILRNSFYDNGDNIDDDAIYLVAGANEGITRPTIVSANTAAVVVEGVASGDTVALYLSDYDGGGYGEGKTFLLSRPASGSSVSFDVSGAGLTAGQWLTAQRTNSNGSTSAFSANVEVP